VIRRIMPTTLKNRLFAAYIFLILLPFSALNIYNFWKVQHVLQQKVSEQSLEQMESLHRSLEDLLSEALKTFILLEQDSAASSLLKDPAKTDLLTRKAAIEEKFKSINNSLFLSSPPVYYTLVDFYGNVYTSFQPSEALNYKQITAASWFRDAMDHPADLQWKLDNNYVYQDISQSDNLLTTVKVLKDDNFKPFAVARISVDYNVWFRSAVQGNPQDYFLVSSDGVVVASSRGNGGLGGESVQRILASGEEGGYYQDSQYMMNYRFMPSLKWFLVKREAADVLFAEIRKQRNSFFLTFLGCTAAFIAITFAISSNITKPLLNLQMKMSDVVRKRFQIFIPEEKYQGEVLWLTQTFNQMVRDMNALIRQLKQEEREKEAVHFQMLLSQMNPHFLLNTLNTIKWIALRNQNRDIAEISVSLGKLLETSLNSEAEMIHLREEIDLVNAYVSIQSFRYQQQFAIEYEVEEKLQYALVPKLSLQPLVENAIQHGLSPLFGQGRRGRIRIRIFAGEQTLYIEVEDNGIGMEQSQQVKTARKRSGIGIKNLRQRLNLLFKERAFIEMLPQPQGTLVRLAFPLLLSTPYGKEAAPDVDGFIG
jgi:two-component system sensor histidine kinase YesM